MSTSMIRMVHALRPAALGAALLAALAGLMSSAPPAVAQQVKSRCSECEASRETHERYGEVMGLLATLQARQDALRFELASLAGDDSTAAALRDQQRELRKAELELRAQMRALERAMRSPGGAPRAHARGARAPVARTGPDGYLGLNLSGSVETNSDDGAVSYYFTDYPVVESVEPGSPAQRAGLLAGDVLLALDNRDLKQARLAMRELLRPGRELPVRVRRGGRARTVTLVVARRPEPWGVIAPDDPREAPMPPLPPMPGVRVPVAPAAPLLPKTPQEIGPISIWVGGVPALAGAQLARLTPEMGTDYFGVDRGVLVLGVGAGTPASRAGLRGGDVIVRAGDTAITTPQQLQRALREAHEERRVDLRVVRKKRTQTIVLRWDDR